MIGHDCRVWRWIIRRLDCDGPIEGGRDIFGILFRRKDISVLRECNLSCVWNWNAEEVDPEGQRLSSNEDGFFLGSS